MELMISLSIFALMSVVFVVVLKNVTDLWRKADAKDDVIRQLLKARSALARDLMNASSKPSEVGVAQVGPHGNPGYDGAALSFLSSDSGSNLANWTVDPHGRAQFQSQITYYLVVPAVPNPNGVSVTGGAADANGYEQQNPFKWLIRRVDTGVSVFNAGWNSWLVQPGSTTLPAGQKLVAERMLGFRILKTGPLWSFELSAVALRDAQKHIALGQVPLARSSYTITERFGIRTNN
ncbi:MAG: hypothetical protein KIS61_21215 [Candidatus Eremiobacteraeota bacterium]|nr:hypothetical protein [Candidatus Eremiobacteraeota bacterium]